jgi:hypothetical protein
MGYVWQWIFKVKANMLVASLKRGSGFSRSLRFPRLPAIRVV